MTDMYDRAQELEQRQRDEALSRQASRLPTRPSLSHCEDCGEEIPPKRRQAIIGCTRCVECQTDFERPNR